jgi:TorA maturation chaperone TorD
VSADAAVTLHHRLAPEDQARAEIYAVLARLYSEAPDAAFLAALGASPGLPETPGEPDSLPAAWNRLVAASLAMDADAARDEYTSLFVGVGRSEVDLHASHWIPEAMSEQPLVELRTDLARMGLGRHPDSNRYEDHLGALFEVMRVLVAGQNERKPAPVAAQRGFFDKNLAPWVDKCCAAVGHSPIANYYRQVAQFTAIFMAIERDAFAID